MPTEMTDTSGAVAILEELLAWTRALALPGVRGTLETTLSTVEERRVFELSDGERTTRDIASSVGVGNAPVSRWWKKWRALGICVEGSRGRSRHLVKLEDLSIPVEPHPGS